MIKTLSRTLLTIAGALLLTSCRPVPSLELSTELESPTANSTAALIAVPEAAAPFPNLEPISPQNIDQLAVVGQLGTGKIYGTALSPDRQTLAVYTISGIYLYESQTLEQTLFIEDPVTGLSGEHHLPVIFSRDGKKLVYADGPYLKFWDLTAKEWDNGYFRSAIPNWDIDQIEFSPDGEHIVIRTQAGNAPCDGQGINYALYDLAGNLLFDRYWCGSSAKHYYRFTEDGKVYFFLGSMMTVVFPLEIHVVDIATGSLLEAVYYEGNRSHTNFSELNLAKLFYDVSPDGKLLATIYYTNGRAVRQILDSATREVVSPLAVDWNDEFLPFKNEKITWQPILGEISDPTISDLPCNLVPSTLEEYRKLLVTDKFVILYVLHFREIQRLELWELQECQIKRKISFPYAEQVLFSPNDDLLAATTGLDIYVWDLSTMKVRFLVAGKSFKKPGNLLVFNADGSRLVVSTLGQDQSGANQPDKKYTLSVWDTRSGKKLLEIRPESEFLEHIAATPDPEIILSQDSGGFAFWNITNGKLQAALPSGAYTFDPLDHGIWVSTPGAINLFDYYTGQALHGLLPVQFPVDKLVINKTGSKIALWGILEEARRYALTVVNTKSRRHLWTNTNFKSIRRCGFDGFSIDRLVIDCESGFEVWDFEQNTSLLNLPGDWLSYNHEMIFSRYENQLQFWMASNARYLGDLDLRYTYRYNKLETNASPLYVSIQPENITNITVSPVGYWIAFTTEDGLIRLWGVPREP